MNTLSGLACGELQRLVCRAAHMATFHRFVQEARERGQQQRTFASGRQQCRLFAHRERGFQQMRRGDVVVMPVVQQARLAAAPEARLVAHPPARQRCTRQRVAGVSPEKARQLQQRRRPQVGEAARLPARGVGEGERMREVKPADVVGDAALGALLVGAIEGQHRLGIGGEQ